MAYTNIMNRAAALEYGPALLPYSGVRLWYEDENAFFAGDETGRVLEADCPWATQAMADNILASVIGYEYQPYEAQDALLDPAAELGDTVGVGGVVGPLARVDTLLDSLCASGISAPSEEEIENEYPYLSPMAKALQRKMTLGASYYGTRITRAKGLEIVKTDADGRETSRVELNADTMAFYNQDGGQALYFDSAAGKFKFSGLLNVSDNFIVDANGNVTINGNINMSGGTITWGENDPGGGLSTGEVRTLINEELVSSPNIAGGRFLDLYQTTWLEMATPNKNVAYLQQYADAYSDYEPVCAMGYYTQGTSDEWVLAPFNKIRLGYSETYDKMYGTGTWDFSQAQVSGLFLRFS